jgi:DNA mismatch endonuclease (patch repair protein)
MQATRRRDTPGEIALRSALTSMGFRYRVDMPLPGLKRRADVAFPRATVAVFVDGCFWHGCPQHGTWPKTNGEWWREKLESNIRRDIETTLFLRRRGWVVFRFWAHDNMVMAAEAVAEILRRKLT